MKYYYYKLYYFFKMEIALVSADVVIFAMTNWQFIKISAVNR